MEILKFSAPLANFALTFSLSKESDFNHWYRSRGKTPPKSLEMKLEICEKYTPSRNEVEFINYVDFQNFQSLVRALNQELRSEDVGAFDRAINTRVEVIIRVIENDI